MADHCIETTHMVEKLRTIETLRTLGNLCVLLTFDKDIVNREIIHFALPIYLIPVF